MGNAPTIGHDGFGLHHDVARSGHKRTRQGQSFGVLYENLEIARLCGKERGREGEGKDDPYYFPGHTFLHTFSSFLCNTALDPSVDVISTFRIGY